MFTCIHMNVVDLNIDVGLWTVFTLHPFRLDPVPVDNRHQFDVRRRQRNLVFSTLAETLFPQPEIVTNYVDTVTI